MSKVNIRLVNSTSPIGVNAVKVSWEWSITAISSISAGC
jgi:hypothetical protein